jgi:signal transduction histidine kinase
MGNIQAWATALVGIVVAAVALRLNRTGLVDRAVLLLLVGMMGATTLSMIVGEGVHDSGMILYPTVIVLGSLLLEPRTNRMLVALVLASVTLVWWLSSTGRIAPALAHMTDVTDLVAIVVVLLVQVVAVGLLSRGLYDSLREARRENAERRAAEEQVRRLNLELERRVEQRTAELAAANADLESFSYSVSHDLRAPLRVANSYASILREEFAAEWAPAARDLLERLLASNVRMSSLIDELLRFSRLGRRELNRREVDMEATVRKVIEEAAADAPGRDIKWVVGKLPAASADPGLIEQVFTNLIGNAVKYSGGEEQARIEIGYDDDGGRPSYFVRDNGVGFDMERAGRLFGVFERLHSDADFEGNGIGLAIAHRILARHGGRIWASAEPGQGATFRFDLPGE